MFDRIKTLIQRWHDLQEIDRLTDRDLDDLGMSREQVRAFALMPADVPDRVMAMGAIFGLSEDELRNDHARWIELLETCGPCDHRGACSLVLSRGDLGHPAECGFCRNRASFAELAEGGHPRRDAA